MRGRRERGATGALIAVILVLIMAGFLATSLAGRVTSENDQNNQTLRKLAIGADALEQYAAINARLPCPANPTLNTGVEVTATAATCSFPTGSIPWSTLGMRYDDAFDAWGRKISYRVYTGDATHGSLTQPDGVSMVRCDTDETVAAGDATPASNGLGGLCVPYPDDPDLKLRTTIPGSFLGPNGFLAGKGLSLNDFGVNHPDVAFVLISYGATGLGAYTVSGVRLPLPPNGSPPPSGDGDEYKNAQSTSTFAARAFSGPYDQANESIHFDDLLSYRTLPDLVRRANLSARVWPET